MRWRRAAVPTQHLWIANAGTDEAALTALIGESIGGAACSIEQVGQIFYASFHQATQHTAATAHAHLLQHCTKFYCNTHCSIRQHSTTLEHCARRCSATLRSAVVHIYCSTTLQHYTHLYCSDTAYHCSTARTHRRSLRTQHRLKAPPRRKTTVPTQQWQWLPVCWSG